MSKKLIAVASAAALALTGLVGVAPANATAATIVWTSASGAGTSASPYTRAVPAANSIASGTNAQVITISNIAVGDSVTVSSSGTAKVIGDTVAASTLIDVRNLCAATLTKSPSGSLPATSGTATTLLFYVFDTKADSPSTITVTVSETDSGTKSTTTTTAVYEASAGVAHHVTNLTGPATLAAGADGEVTFKVTDVFGNELDTVAAGPSITGTNVGSLHGELATYSVSRKLWVAKVTAPANTRPMVLTIDGNDDGTDGPGNAGLGASTTDNNIILVNGPGASTQVSALTAQVAALTAQVAKRVSKKKYNTLARKWNAAFPSQKVALKK
jgi:hypothetical protein